MLTESRARLRLHNHVSPNAVFRMTRNGQLYETELIGNATSVLSANLPATWWVEVAEGEAQGQYDALLKISNETEVTATFAIEAKSITRESADKVVSQLLAYARSSPHPLVFVTEYINAPLRRKCEDEAISYLDATGWAFVVSSAPPILIRLEGANKPPRPRESTATARLSGPAAARAIRQLLISSPPLGIRELARRSSSSPAAVSKLMPTLVASGAVERSTDGTVTRIRRRTLLDRWTADYSFLNSNGVVLDYVAPRIISRTLERIRERDDVCVTGTAAAREYLPSTVTSVLPTTQLTLYAKDITGAAKSLGLVRADRAVSNVMLTTPRDSTLLDDARPSPSGMRIAPLGQVLADLQTLPGRTAQQAEQIIDLLASDDPSWSE